MSNILDWPKRPLPRIRRAAATISKLGAFASLLGETTLEIQVRQSLTDEADAATMALERLADRCRRLGQTVAAASYRKLADDAHLVASRIEAPNLTEQDP